MLTWPTVGRDEELGFVVTALRGDRTRGVVLAGELGVGKTRLAREAVGAVGDTVAVEWLAATPASAEIPFGAVAHLIEDHHVGTVGDRLRIVRGIRSALHERAVGQPLLVAVDDAQWLDTGTAALVHQLVVSGGAQVLLTIRTEEATPDPIVACWKDGWVERLEVQPLSAVDVSDLVTTAVGGPVDRLTLHRLWALSQGNPLFLHEVVRSAIETNAVTRRDGLWSWEAPVGTSNRLAQILESRLSRVTAAGRRVLDVLAVGQPLPTAVLEDLHGAEAVVEVERLGLTVVDEQDGDKVRLCHPLYGDALLTGMGASERRRVTGQLADAMASAAEGSRAMRLRVAVWRHDSGASITPAALVEAAELANAMYDHALAERLARQAVAAGGGLPAALVLAESLNRQGRCIEALIVLDPLPEQAQTDEEHVAIATGRYFALTSEQGFRVEFADVVLAAERQVRDPSSLAYLRASRAALLCSAGRLEDGVSLALQAIEEHPDEATELRAVSPLVGAWLCTGRADTAVAMTERMLEPAMRLREQIPQGPGWVMSLHLPGLVIAGRLDDADAAASAIEAIVTSSGGSADAAAFISLTRGMSSLQRGQVRTACGHLRESVALLRPIARWRLPFALVQLVEASALAGDAAGAAAASAEADALVRHHAIFEGAARRVRGWVALARGERSSAVELFLAAADWSGAHGQRTAELLALHDAIRFGPVRRAAERLEAVAATTEGLLAPRLAAHARALSERDGPALLAAASGFEEIGTVLLAAESCAQASLSFAQRGSRSAAERAAGRAWALAAACEQPQTPVLDELERPLPLTRREREVAGLAATGVSSQVIADRLFLSVRTVEGHLQNAYGKLGVHDRAGLAEVLSGGGG